MSVISVNRVYLGLVPKVGDLDGLAAQPLEVADAEAFERTWKTLSHLSHEKLVQVSSVGHAMIVDKGSGDVRVTRTDRELLEWGSGFVALRETVTKLHAGCFDVDQVEEQYIAQIKRLKNGVLLERRLYIDQVLCLAYCECDEAQQAGWADVASAHMKRVGLWKST